MSSSLKGRIHVVIGDTQVKRGVPTRHLEWIGRYVADQFYGQNVALNHLGDHWDMPSLSSYDVGKKEMENRRIVEDIDAGNEGFDLINEPILRANKGKKKKWDLEKNLFLGNHCHRITRACEDNPQLEGTVTLASLNAKSWGWKVHDFLKPVDIDGILYAHYFYNPNTGRPYCGENLYPRLKTIGTSFTMGHQQGVQYCIRPVGNQRHHGLVLGSSYLHNEKYLGPQGNAYWRGIVVCHQVERGSYDPMMVSLEYLCRRYEKKTLAQFLKS